MSAERAMWTVLRPFLTLMDPVRIENTAGRGVPDVNYVNGWIELKAAARWPVRGGQLPLPHFTPQQRVWLERRWRAGGLAWLLLRVKNDPTTGPGGMWMLFDGWTAFDTVGKATRAVLWDRAAWRGEHLVEMLPWLRGKSVSVGGRAMLQRLRACCTREEVADTLEWKPGRVEEAERDLNSEDALTLADYWNS